MYSEGSAVIEQCNGAFLNSEARFSRDISIAFAKAFMRQGSKVLDPTSATGIRGIRYSKEAGADVTFLEINKNAFDCLSKNLSTNGVSAVALNKSIQEFCNTTSEKFDLIDLDPFGSPAPYINDIMKVSRDGTYLMVTATDTAVLCGAHHMACIMNYNSRPMHGEICHEVGIRILIRYIAGIATQFNYGINVSMSFVHKHYMRTILKLNHGAKMAHNTISDYGYAYKCVNCGYRSVIKGQLPSQEKCPLCGSKLEIGGPLWAGIINDKKALISIKRHLQDESEALKLVSVIDSEADIPLYYHIPSVTKRLKIGAVSPLKVIECLSKKGFSASLTHMQQSSIRTDASASDIDDCVRQNAGNY